MDPEPVSGSLLLFRRSRSDSRPDSEAVGDGARPAALAAECGWQWAVSCLRLDMIRFIAVGCVLPTARHTARYNSVLRLSVSHIARLYKIKGHGGTEHTKA